MEYKIRCVHFSKISKKIFLALFMCLAFAVKSFALDEPSAYVDNSNLLVQGLEEYKSGDWTSATFLLRKAVTVPANSTAETWYMLIMRSEELV